MIRPSYDLPDHRAAVRRRANDSRHGAGYAQRAATTGAFTLLEVLLVVAIMIAVLAIAWPSFQGSFDQQRLKKAGQRIQTEWTKARNRAIRTGRVHVFQHTLFSNRFVTRVQSSAGDEWQSEAAESDTTQFTATPDETLEKLPQGIFFMAADVQLDQRTTLEMSSLDASPVVADFSADTAMEEMTGEQSWGMPIFFFPDGTTSSAQMVLANENQESVTLQLRGLTGMVRLGRVESMTQRFPSEAMSR